jgi:SAM-dependent methyltransferase
MNTHAWRGAAVGAFEADAFTRFERDGWSRAAEGYHRFFSPVTGQVAEPLLDAAHIAAHATVLDVATGAGGLAACAAARGASVIGVDIAEPVVALAAHLNPGLDFRRADAHALPFADASFTAVVANFLLPHLGDHHTAAAEMTRVLAPGGWLAVSTWDVPERAAVLGIVVAAVAEAGVAPPAHLPAGPPFFAYSTDEALVGLLRGAGLHEVRARRLSFTHRVASPDELWNGVLDGTVRTAALVGGQPPHVRRRIRAAFDRLAANYAAGAGLELPVSVQIASGRK